MTNKLTIAGPRAMFITANDRHHWHKKADLTRTLRYRANLEARTRLTPTKGPVHVYAEIGYPPRATKADPDNYQPTVKALIDGIVDAGILPDDDSKHVVSTTYTRARKATKPGQWVITITLTDQHVPF